MSVLASEQSHWQGNLRSLAGMRDIGRSCSTYWLGRAISAGDESLPWHIELFKASIPIAVPQLRLSIRAELPPAPMSPGKSCNAKSVFDGAISYIRCLPVLWRPGIIVAALAMCHSAA